MLPERQSALNFAKANGRFTEYSKSCPAQILTGEILKVLGHICSGKNICGSQAVIMTPQQQTALM